MATSGLPYSATEKHIRDHFADIGHSTVQLLGVSAGRSDGTGFINFLSAEMALHACTLTGRDPNTLHHHLAPTESHPCHLAPPDPHPCLLNGGGMWLTRRCAKTQTNITRKSPKPKRLSNGRRRVINCSPPPLIP